MAINRIVRANDSEVEVNLSGGEYIDYSLTVSGARGAFSLTDGKKRVVMMDSDWPASQRTFHRRWPLDTPQAPPEASVMHTLTFSFFTAFKYSYVASLCSADGKVLRIIKDMDFESQNPLDTTLISHVILVS